MKAEINESKQLLIIPENGTEVMGLEAWTDLVLGNGGQVEFLIGLPDADGLMTPFMNLRHGEVRGA